MVVYKRLDKGQAVSPPSPERRDEANKVGKYFWKKGDTAGDLIL